MVSYFADVPKADLPSDATVLVRVMTPAAPGVHLGQTVAMTHFIPQAAPQAHFETSLHRHARAKLHGLGRAEGRKGKVVSGRLHGLGLTQLPRSHDQALSVLPAGQSLITPLETAAALVAQQIPAVHKPRDPRVVTGPNDRAFLLERDLVLPGRLSHLSGTKGEETPPFAPKSFDHRFRHPGWQKPPFSLWQQAERVL